MRKELVAGVLGLGRIGKLHINNLVKNVNGVRIKTVTDIFLNDETIAWAENLGIENISKDEEAVFSDPEINVVIICSSTDTHTDFIRRAAKAGKDIFCEKPIGTDLLDIDETLKIVDKAGVKLQVGFVRRFDHNHSAVAKTVSDGLIGKAEIIKITSRDPAPPPIEYVKVSGGIFFDMMIHDFDMARFLSGSEVVSVYSKGAVLVDKKIGEAGDVDTAIVTLEFANGAVGVIENSRRACYGYDQRTEVHGELGCVQGENDTSNMIKISNTNGVTHDKPRWFFLERYNDAFVLEMQLFVSAILNGEEVPVTGKDGMESVKIAVAAQMSQEKKRPVMLSEITW